MFRILTIYNMEKTFWKPNQPDGTIGIEISCNILTHFIGYCLALKYSCLLNLNNIQDPNI